MERITPELATVSCKGQLVIPKDIRKELGIGSGSVLSVYADKKREIVVMKKIELPEKRQVFEELHSWGVNFAKNHKIKKEDLRKAMENVRGHD